VSAAELGERFQKQLDFIIEIDRAKQILRRTLLTDGSRRENDAEHSWHIAVMAMILQEHAADSLDLSRTLQMLLIHDIVEIDAGDTFSYDEKAQADKAEREAKAADRLFGLLPEDQGRRLRELWEEFEARRTPEARFAAALDRLQPLMHNYITQGAAWRAHGVTKRQVIERNRHIAESAPSLWAYASSLIEDAVQKGYLPE